MLKLAPMIISSFTQEAGSALQQKRRNILLYLVMGVFFLTAYIAAILALSFYLSELAEPITAWLVISIATLSSAILILAVVMFLNHRDKRKHANHQAVRKLATTAALASLPKLSASSKKIPLLMMIVIAGFAAYSHYNSSTTRDDD